MPKVQHLPPRKITIDKYNISLSTYSALVTYYSVSVVHIDK